MSNRFIKYIRLDRFFKRIILFLELKKAPLAIGTLIYLIGWLIWLIWSWAEIFFQWLGFSSAHSSSLKYLLIGIVLIIFSIFFVNVITSMFSLNKRVRILVRSYSEDIEIISFLNNKIKEWLADVSNLTENKPSKTRKYSNRQLEKIENSISKKGKYLEALVTEVSNFLEISEESIEDLTGFKIGVNKNIAKNIIYNYKRIQNANSMLEYCEPDDREYYESQKDEKLRDLEKIERTLSTQIKWNRQLEEHQKDIKLLINIIKEESTGKAIMMLVELLKSAKTSEQLKFLIQAANARVGYKLGELLGFKLVPRTDESTELTWYDQLAQLEQVQIFLKKFEILRKKSISGIIEKFNEYERVDYSQPISIALTYGYSAVLSKVLQSIILRAKDDGRVQDLHVKLIKSEGPTSLISCEKTFIRCEKTPMRGEVQLRDELISIDFNIKDKCNIFPIEMIKEREMERQISKIFIGVESVNMSGNVVHPRGSTNIIKQIKEKNPNVKVYAFGETYKVQDFDDFHIDYTKLSMLEGSKYIDYIITDDGVHTRTTDGWNLNCCIMHWRNRLHDLGLL